MAAQLADGPISAVSRHILALRDRSDPPGYLGTLTAAASETIARQGRGARYRRIPRKR